MTQEIVDAWLRQVRPERPSADGWRSPCELVADEVERLRERVRELEQDNADLIADVENLLQGTPWGNPLPHARGQTETNGE